MINNVNLNRRKKLTTRIKDFDVDIDVGFALLVGPGLKHQLLEGGRGLLDGRLK
jgi:hypothetical protein